MRPEELRIGNYIKDYDCEPYFFKVEEIHRNTQGTIAVYYRNSSIMDVEPGPIQLTEEWLIKLGFDQKMIMLNSPDRYLVLSAFVDQKRMYFYLEDTFGGRFDLNFIEYVHQLQNLYYCLTGKELTIK